MDCFSLGDLNTVGIARVTSRLNILDHEASDTVATPLKAYAGLVVVILSIKNS